MSIVAPKDGTVVYEQGDYTYLIAPVAPVNPTESEIEEFAFGKSAVKQAQQAAPNPMISWFGGHYVEADNPNLNGAMWRGKEIAIKSLTPMFMPVTVMHDPRVSVGLIADVALKTPDEHKVPRAKIETALALWKHRYPEAVEEAEHNYQHGMLMQSMECLSPDYECSECGMVFHKLPDGQERANWCAHLRGEGTPNGSRILRNTVFTGTGLIYGSRGAEGADSSAYLESFQEEVAEHHQRVHRDSEPTRSQLSMATIQVEESEYKRLQQERDDLKARADKAESEKADAERKVEEAEAAKAKAEEDKAEAEKKVNEHEETARKATLRDERLGKLGSAFTEKLSKLPTVEARLKEQAASMSDEDWTGRLKEVAEMTGVEPDAVKDGSGEDAGNGGDGGGSEETAASGESLFSREEVASAKAGGSGDPSNGNGTQTEQSRRSVVAGLVKNNQ